MTSGNAERLLSRKPDEIRTLVTMMTDDELRDLMLYFRLGVLHFLLELDRAESLEAAAAASPESPHGVG